MNVADFIFAETKKGGSLPAALIADGYITKDKVAQFYDAVASKEFQGLMKLLVVINDRSGMDMRPEDAYNKFQNDITSLVAELYKNTQKDPKKKV